MAHGDAWEEKWRGNKRMEWVTSKRHMTAEHRLARAVQTLQADVYSLPAISRLNWPPRRFKWTRPFRRKTKSGFCACAIMFQTQSTHRHTHTPYVLSIFWERHNTDMWWIVGRIYCWGTEKALCMLCQRWKGTFKTYLSFFCLKSAVLHVVWQGIKSQHLWIENLEWWLPSCGPRTPRDPRNLFQGVCKYTLWND